MNRKSIAVAVAVAVLGGAAWAQSTPASPADAPKRPMFSQLDADGDGRISREEAARHPRLGAAFDRLDTNRDGFLSPDELRRPHGQRGPRGQAGAKLDVNGDGYISREEAQAAPRLAQQFDRLDTNQDGMLSRDELRAGWGGRHAGQRPKLDVNGDGYISRDEAQGSPRLSHHFDAIDANRDGMLSRDELSAWRQSRRMTPRT